MATSIKCDICEKDDAFRVVCDVSTGGGDRVKSSPKFDCDLCKKCFDRAMSALKAAFPEAAYRLR